VYFGTLFVISSHFRATLGSSLPVGLPVFDDE